MNDQQIYILMAQTPDIRAVQIADALNGDLADVSNALKPLVEVGDVVRTAGVSPNGHPCQIYNLSEQFMKSREYAEVMAIVAAKTAVVPSAAVPVDQKTRESLAMPDRVGDAIALIRATATPIPRQTKGEIAAAFIRAQPDQRASNAQLREVLGMDADQHPSGYLGSAIKHGRLARDGDAWVLGANIPVVRETKPVEPVDATLTVDKLWNAAKQPATITVPSFLRGPVEMITSSPPCAHFAPAPPADVDAPGYRCALWSDGQVEVQYDGLTVALMPRAGADALAGYLAQLVAA
jgi:hypothetical protein